MKKVLLFAISAALLLTLVISLTAHAYFASANCWRVYDDNLPFGGYTRSDAMAGSHGLIGKPKQDGYLDAYARVGTGADFNFEQAHFKSNFVKVTAHFVKKDVLSYAKASSNVWGWVLHNEGQDNEFYEKKDSGASDELPAVQ